LQKGVLKMAKDIRKPQKPLREVVGPRLPDDDKERFKKACFDGEKETAEKAEEFVKRISGRKEWALEDWIELCELADLGRTLMEMRIAMT